jgi:hypothetical protein
MLEAELNCPNVPPRAGRASSVSNRPLTTPLFVFDLPRPVVRRDDVDLRSCAPPLDSAPRNPGAHVHPLTRGRATPFREPPTTPKTPLNALERRALAMLNDLGADLGEHLSPGTLRRAFRRLARRYHPDRHPGNSAAELDRLGRLFADATEHYRVLAAALTKSDPGVERRL